MTGPENSPPAELTDRVLAAARTARPVGRAVPAPPPVNAAEAFSRAADALAGLLCALDDDAWHLPVLRDLTVQELVGHLLGVELDLHRALRGAAQVGAADHVSTTQPTAVAQAGRIPADTYRDWREAVDVSISMVADVLPGTVDGLHGLRLPVDALLVARSFEFWAHENDIRAVAGFPASEPDPSSLVLMTDLAVGMLPRAMAAHDRGGATAPLHLVLTGAGGGTWDIAIPAAPDAADAGRHDPAELMIVTSAVDFCRLAANRLAPADIDAHVVGDAVSARRVLAAMTTLALD